MKGELETLALLLPLLSASLIKINNLNHPGFPTKNGRELSLLYLSFRHK
jgi:hypothetical protein